MENLTKYILFVFAKNDNPKEFTEQIADELSILSDVPKVNFYFGPESSVFTISTLDSFEDVKDYVSTVLDVGEITYILLPYTPDNMSYGLPSEVSKHLFNDGVNDFMSGKSEKLENKEDEVRNMIRKHINEEFFLDLSEFISCDDEDEDEIIEIKNRRQKPSLDQLLEKIKEKGLNSLTEKELSQLNKYSN